MLDILDVKFIGKPFWGEGIENTKFVSDNSGREVRSYKGWLEQVLSMSVFIFVVIKVNTYGFSWLCGCWTRIKLNKTKLSLKPPRFLYLGWKVLCVAWIDLTPSAIILFYLQKNHILDVVLYFKVAVLEQNWWTRWGCVTALVVQWQNSRLPRGTPGFDTQPAHELRSFFQRIQKHFKQNLQKQAEIVWIS